MNEGSSAKQQIVEGIKANSNILVTVSDSPNVDELSAALGLTMLLNKIEKRATAIFSGDIPPAITFLDPSKTFESTVDSLRDFIIALDKEKADHLRYKVDGDVVKIFITPYKTTLSDKDLTFSQGDYNVEMVIALGVRDPEHLDKALSAHGRILHDALVTTISIGENNSLLGSVDWRDAMASSYSEVLVSLVEALKGETPILDQQIATALLTGIVSATERFSNDRTSSRVMTMAAQLMAAGADQQLIAAKLQENHALKADIPAQKQDATKDEATIDINKDDKQPKKDKKKKDDTAMQIDRGADTKKSTALKTIEPISDPNTIKPEELMTPAQEADALANAAAVDAAMDQASVQDNMEQSFAAAMAPVAPAPEVPSLEQELAAAMQTEEQPQQDTGMPGFEPLPPPPIEPAPEAPSRIQGHSGGDYIAGDAVSSFDSPVNAMPSETPAQPADAPADVLGAPVVATPMDSLPPLPPAPEMTPTDVAQAPLEAPALPPLPPMPDFSTLPPLPAPDMPPVFDQPIVAPVEPIQPAPIDPEKLGDIFGDAPAAPPPAPSEPTPPSQFKIPGQ